MACKEEDYQKALSLWDKEGFTTFKECLIYYCKLDVQLLMEAMNRY